MTYQAGVIQVPSLLDSDEVGNLRRHEHAGAAAGRHGRWNRFARRDQCIQAHSAGNLVWVVGQPGHLKLASEAANSVQEFRRSAGLSGSPEHPGALTVSRIITLSAGN